MGVALLLMSVASSRAEPAPDPPDYGRNGFYLGAAGTYAITTENPSFNDTLGVNFRLGYRGDPHGASEMQFEWLGPNGTNGTSIPGIDIDHAWMLSGNFKVFLLTGRFQPFVQAGPGVMHAKIKGFGASTAATEFAARFGGGLDIYTTEHIVVSLDAAYILPTGDLKTFDYVSIGWGFQYRF
jgi:opacity protein-like surface antigen